MHLLLERTGPRKNLAYCEHSERRPRRLCCCLHKRCMSTQPLFAYPFSMSFSILGEASLVRWWLPSPTRQPPYHLNRPACMSRLCVCLFGTSLLLRGAQCNKFCFTYLALKFCRPPLLHWWLFYILVSKRSRAKILEAIYDLRECNYRYGTHSHIVLPG
jgi:hypothetical protein